MSIKKKGSPLKDKFCENDIILDENLKSKLNPEVVRKNNSLIENKNNIINNNNNFKIYIDFLLLRVANENKTEFLIGKDLKIIKKSLFKHEEDISDKA